MRNHQQLSGGRNFGDNRGRSREIDTSFGHEILTTAQLAAEQRRLRDRPGVSWYGRIIIIATLSVGAIWGILQALTAAFSTHW